MHLRRPAALLGAAALTTASLAMGPAARAADTPKTGTGAEGQRLSVSATANLNPAGETLRVTGAGYDTTKAVYVALCRDNGDGKVPGPCVGGADQSGEGGASHWIVPEGDPYAGVLATTWGAGGTFDVEIRAQAKDASVDCLRYSCSVVTRVDHRNTGDRSQDVRVPVTWEGQDTGGGGDGGDGVDVPPGTISYVRSAAFTTVGRPLDLLLHPDSGKLYVGSENIPDTGDVAEQGLYVVDPENGELLSHIAQAPGAGGTMAARVVRRIIGPLAGDGVAFHFPLRGIGTAKDGDTAARGHWFDGTSFTGVDQDADTSSVLIAAGPELRRVELATGAVTDTVTLEGGGRIGVDAERGVAWSIGTAGETRVLRRVDTATFKVTATTEIPADDSVFFVETDPATGNVWVGGTTSVLVFDEDGTPLTTLTGVDRPSAAAFDKATGRAFVLRENLSDSTGDDDGSVEVLDGATFERAAAPVTLPGSESTSYAGIAVAPGATSVYVTRGTANEVVRLDLRRSPKVVRSPTDQSVAPGDEVTLTAAAEGTPEPTVAWSVSPDGGQTWSAVEGATENTYTFTAKAAQDGYAYRAEFTNPAGTTRTAPVTLTVKEAPGTDPSGPPADGDGDGDDEPSGSRTVTGPDGQKLTVTPVNHLATENQTLKVTGSGYDEEKGVYVALCVDNGEGELPTPCIGGVDMTGGSHSSAWISSDPPDYGEDLAVPYEDGGSFEVELTVDAKDEYTDCFKAKCVLATRADHTLSGDRSQDVKVPVAFVGQDPVDTDDDGTGGTDTPDDTDPGTGGTDGDTGGTSGGTGGGTVTTGSTSGSLASTGVTVLSVAALAAALTATGWVARRRARTAA
ncbi:immunoglobulin I-set domain protein [Streptomyces sp. NPDC017966]|uniref:immunoglobulin I-set domain protein n=1 Tax=Streptomyces sp. NPDC017966 TaxID=3365023 RepID=UPI0037B0108B